MYHMGDINQDMGRLMGGTTHTAQWNPWQMVLL